ncbi:MAG: hypothetical protein M1815_000095 [Lichina confinis]|nr:MAG: hypothetical protein M1815_000095 [Lichina confinis]
MLRTVLASLQLLVFSHVAAALPPQARGRPVGERLIATFDEFDTPPVGITSMPTDTPYQGLAFQYSVSRTAFINMVRPPSSPNSAGFGLAEQLENPLQPAGFTSVYRGSDVKSFDVNSFYYACVWDSPASFGIPIGCRIRVTGKKARSGKPVGPVDLEFEVPPAMGWGRAQATESMSLARLGAEFQGIESCRQEVIASSIVGVDPKKVILRLDNLEHINYYV